MGAFGGLVFTNRGRNLQAKAQTGEQLLFTRIAIGDGYLGGASIVELNALRNERKSLNITKLRTSLDGASATIGTVLSNQEITSGFYFREIGIFALDPTQGEVLYCYANAGDTADYIPAGGGEDVLEKTIDLKIFIGNAPNVSAVIDESLVYETTNNKGLPNGYASLDEEGNVPLDQLGNVVVEVPVNSVNGKTGDVVLTAQDVGAATPADVQAVDDKVVSHTADDANPHNVTKAQVGLGNVQNYGMANQPQAESGTATNVYMNPKLTKDAIKKLSVLRQGDPNDKDILVFDANLGLWKPEPRNSLEVDRYYTEGVEDVSWSNGRAEGNYTRIKQSGNFYFHLSNNETQAAMAIFVTSARMDLTSINRLQVDWEKPTGAVNLQSHIGISKKQIIDVVGVGGYDAYKQNSSATFMRQTDWLDVSQFVGEYYIHVGVIDPSTTTDRWGTLKVYSIWGAK